MNQANRFPPLVSQLAYGHAQGPSAASRAATTIDSSNGKASVQVHLDCPPERVMELLTNYEDLPSHIFCLHEVEVLRRFDTTASVRYTMKLPFPLATVQWTNLVSAESIGDGAFRMEWTLVEGDLAECRGQILLHPAGEFGSETRALYQIHVEHRNRLPRSAQQLVIRWLMPRVINRLCKKLEAHGKE